MVKDRTYKFLQRAIDKSRLQELRLPFVVCAATPGGSVFCFRIHGDGRPNEILAEHVGPDNSDPYASIACLLLDETGKRCSLTIEATGKIQ